MRRSAVVVAMIVLAFAGIARGQEPSKAPPPAVPAPVKPDVQPVGEVPDAEVEFGPGERAPDFTLESSLGRAVKAAELEGHWAVIVFSPGRARFAALAPVADSLAGTDARPFGLCQDGASALASYAQAQHLPFTLLSDPTGQVAQLFGMYDAQRKAIQPGVVVVDARGIVRGIVQGPDLSAVIVLAAVHEAMAGN